MTDNTVEERLRALLRSAERIPVSGLQTAGEISPNRKSSSSKSTRGIKETPKRSVTDNSSQELPSAVPNIPKVRLYLPTGPIDDEIDHTVVKCGSEVSLRSKVGLYLQAVASSVSNPIVSADTPVISATSKSPIVVYSLGVSGQGIGEPLDCLVFNNLDTKIKDDKDYLRYGMTVSIRAPAAKERYDSCNLVSAVLQLIRLLGVSKTDSKPGFYRNLVGSNERWLILKGSTAGRGAEDIDSRGKYVRVGDLVLLQTASSEQLLTLYEGATGSDARFIHRDTGGYLGDELWQMELFRSQPQPLWLNRPYLR